MEDCETTREREREREREKEKERDRKESDMKNNKRIDQPNDKILKTVKPPLLARSMSTPQSKRSFISK